MIAPGTRYTTDAGRQIRVENLIQQGGQGEAYLVTAIKSGEQGVLKTFFSSFNRQETIERINFIIAQKLHEVCPVLVFPREILTTQHSWVGHYTPLALGQSLEEFLTKPAIGFMENLVLAIALAHAVSELHARHIAHGDLHASNLLVHLADEHGVTVPQLSLIDPDNFNAPKLPLPPCVGHNLYMAPELYEAMQQKRSVVPDLATDLFALGVLMHEVILLKHVATGADHDQAEFYQAMCSGIWLHDPARTVAGREDLGGYPSTILNADLSRLFRRSLSRNPHERPTAVEWKLTLCKALRAVFQCPNCSAPCLIDSSKQSCPSCHKHYPVFKLVTSTGITIALDCGAILVGRDSLGGLPQISSRHAAFRLVGPETRIESLGGNGTFRWAGSDWIRLPEGTPILLCANDRLKFADLEAQVVVM